MEASSQNQLAFDSTIFNLIISLSHERISVNHHSTMKTFQIAILSTCTSQPKGKHNIQFTFDNKACFA